MKKRTATTILSVASLFAFGTACSTDSVDDPPDSVDPAPDQEPGDTTPTSLVRGRVAQNAGMVAGSTAGAATTIRALDTTTIDLSVVGEAAVAVDGSFSIEVPAAVEGLILVALDVDLNVVAQVILDVSALVGEIAISADLNLETTIEAQIALNLFNCSPDAPPHGNPHRSAGAPGRVNTIDIRARITAELAAAIAASIDLGASVDVQIHALAQAIISAQTVELGVYAAAGIDISADVLIQAALAASVQLNVDLAAGIDVNVATAQFLAALNASVSAMVGAEVHAQAQVAAAIAFNLVLEALLDVDVDVAANVTIDAAISAALNLNLQIVLDVLHGILVEGGATASLLVQLDGLLASLGLELGLSATLGDVLATVDSLLEGLLGDDSILGGLLSILGLDELLSGNLLEEALSIAIDLSAKLHVDLAAALSAEVHLGACIDLDVVAALTIEAVAKFSADLHAEITLLGIDVDVDAHAVADVLALVHGLLSISL